MNLKTNKVPKKALIIAYYWPPAGGPGVQRWLKFVKYLGEFDIQPIVYIPENPNYPIIDESLQNDIPKDITILKQPINEPYRFAKMLSGKQTKTISSGIISENKKQSIIESVLLYIRGNFFIPDARKAWIKPSVNFLSSYILKESIDLIITTGPPHSLHLIGMKLQSKLAVKWLADFRDPWTTIGYHDKLKLTKNSKNKHKALERDVLNSADAITVTSFTTKKEFENLTQKPIQVITNGYDIEKLDLNFQLDSKFTLAHIGSLLSKRNPIILWQSLKELIEEHIDFAKDFKLNLIGTVSKDVIETIKDFQLFDFVSIKGYVSHKEAIKFQKQSQVLLLVEINSEATKCIIPGKLFEYMASNRPIIALGPEYSDIEKILKETNSGKYFKYDEKTALKNVILKYYSAYKNQELKVNAIGLQAYSRRSLTKQLADFLKTI